MLKGKWIKYNLNSPIQNQILINNSKIYNTNWNESNIINSNYSECVYIFYLENIPKILISIGKDNSLYDVKGRGIDEILEEKMIDIFIDKINNIGLDETELKSCMKYSETLKKLYSINNKKELPIDDIKYLYLARSRVEREVDYNNIPLFDKILEKRNILEDYEKLDEKDKVKMLLKYGSDHKELFKDKKVILKAISINPSLFKLVDKDDENYYDIAKFAVKKNPVNIDYVSPDYENYKKIAVLAVLTNPYALESINESAYNYVRNNKKIDFETLKMDKNLAIIIDEMDSIIEENSIKNLKMNKKKDN